MSRGGKEETMVLSEQKQQDLELYCLNRDLEIYKMFVNNVIKMLNLTRKARLWSPREETDTEKSIGQLNHLLGLLEQELKEK